ncbi:alpha/beta hydrolase family esterase [Rhizobium oryzicola]|uniref:PHB depolymerase family esterase n=1 Tax=Rhizobium oryzicola TaxID=1232668 RepID=A0ABT8SUR5_9HYPH|nr:PHB depolymerase family esterase [Rhizobium oryzicola]MDO1582162.1 PHB depolymerase family esterase [Rhizobium oryzicola]
MPFGFVTAFPFARAFARPLANIAAAGAIFLGATAMAQAAGCGTPVQSGYQTLTVPVGSIERHAVIYIPPAYTGSEKLSVVFDFHGSNSNPRGQMERSSFDKVAAKEGFIVVAPQGSLSGKMPDTYAWNVPFVTTQEGGLDEIPFIKATVEAVKQDFCVDPTKIFASGYSGGGRMLSAYVCSGASDFASVGFVNSMRAGLPVERDGKWGPDPASCNPARPLSVIAFAGQKDVTNPYVGGGKPYWQYSFKVALQRWTELDNCKGNGVSESADGVTYSLYGTCGNGARIATYEFADADHEWPTPSSKQRVMAAAAESQAGVVKVSAAKKPSFDPNVDPAQRMWDFFRKADSTDLVAKATPAAAKAKAVVVVCGADAAADQNAEGMTCSNSQPVDQRRSALGAKGAL